MRSALLTGVAVCLALLAAAVAAVYLDPASTGLWVNLLVCILVLAVPLATKAPLTRRRLLITALIWFVLGLPGGYFFGTPVYYASVLLGAALLIDVAVTRRSARTPQKSPATVQAGRQPVDSE
jgi:hypothetical protein